MKSQILKLYGLSKDEIVKQNQLLEYDHRKVSLFIKEKYNDKDILNALDEIHSYAKEIDTLFSFDTDDDEWDELFESFFDEGTFILPEDMAKMF